MQEPIYCTDCKVVALEKGQLELCKGCTQALIDWILWDDYAVMLNSLEHAASDHLYQSQFTL